MFGFAKAPKEPLSDARSAERWLSALATTDPLAFRDAVIGELARVAEPSARRKPAELEALFVLDAHARSVRNTLVAQYIEHATRSPRIESQLWEAMFQLTEGFLTAYAAYEREALEGRDARWRALLPELIVREMSQLSFDAKLRMFRYEPWIPAKWAELHARFALACTHHLERERLHLQGEAKPVTIEHVYIVTLVLHLANSGNLSRSQLDWLATHLESWCSSLRMSVTSPAGTAFYVDKAHGTGLRRRGADPLEAEVLFLDTDPLHSLLQHYILAIEQKIRSQPLSSKTSLRAERLTLLTKVAAQVDTQFRPVQRRGERTAAAGRVDAIVGLSAICGYLREEERAPIPELDTVSTFSGTLDLAVFGHLRNDRDKRKELARRRIAAFAPPGGAWDMKDVSATGVRLIAPMEAACTLTLGMVAVLRGESELVWRLGVIRRMRRMTPERAEVGLQRIADTVAVIDMVAQAPGENAAEGITTQRERRFRGLLLILRQANRTNAVQSLIMPLAEYRPRSKYRLCTSQRDYPIRCGTLLERGADWVWVSLEPLAIEAQHSENALAPGD